MRTRTTRLAALAPLAALVAAGAAGAAERGGGGSPPRIVELEYYEDLDDGRRYNIVATIRGNANRVSARHGEHRSAGRESGQISPGGRGKSWFFREGDFVRAVREDLDADGAARVTVRARGGGSQVRKRCRLELDPDPDPLYGDYATGPCRRP